MKDRLSPVSSCSEGNYLLNWCRKIILPHERKYLWVCKAKEEGDQDPLGRCWETGHHLAINKQSEDTCVDKVKDKVKGKLKGKIKDKVKGNIKDNVEEKDKDKIKDKDKDKNKVNYIDKENHKEKVKDFWWWLFTS